MTNSIWKRGIWYSITYCFQFVRNKIINYEHALAWVGPAKFANSYILKTILPFKWNWKEWFTTSCCIICALSRWPVFAKGKRPIDSVSYNLEVCRYHHCWVWLVLSCKIPVIRNSVFNLWNTQTDACFANWKRSTVIFCPKQKRGFQIVTIKSVQIKPYKVNKQNAHL